MSYYLGVTLAKIVENYRVNENGNYVVQLFDNKKLEFTPDEFRKWFFTINNKDKLTKDDIDRFQSYSFMDTKTDGDKLTVTKIIYPTTFAEVFSSGCVDSFNYDKEEGRKSCIRQSNERLWKYLGFILQWAVSGLSRVKLTKSVLVTSDWESDEFNMVKRFLIDNGYNISDTILPRDLTAGMDRGNVEKYLCDIGATSIVFITKVLSCTNFSLIEDVARSMRNIEIIYLNNLYDLFHKLSK